jgi:hypothetical protein
LLKILTRRVTTGVRWRFSDNSFRRSDGIVWLVRPSGTFSAGLVTPFEHVFRIFFAFTIRGPSIALVVTESGVETGWRRAVWIAGLVALLVHEARISLTLALSRPGIALSIVDIFIDA